MSDFNFVASAVRAQEETIWAVYSFGYVGRWIDWKDITLPLSGRQGLCVEAKLRAGGGLSARRACSEAYRQ